MLPGTATVDKRAQRWHDISIHEAGHAVIGILVDLPIHEMRLRRTLFGHVRGRTEVAAGSGTVLGTTEQDLAFTIGGLEAEAMWIAERSGVSLSRARRKARGGKSEDLAAIADCLRDPGFGKRERDDAEAWVHDQLGGHWDTVEELAAALRVDGHLSRHQIASLV